MATVKINKDKCKGCSLCIIYCPNNILSASRKLNKKGIHVVEFSEKNKSCTGCAMCAIICPDCAIEVYR